MRKYFLVVLFLVLSVLSPFMLSGQTNEEILEVMETILINYETITIELIPLVTTFQTTLPPLVEKLEIVDKTLTTSQARLKNLEVYSEDSKKTINDLEKNLNDLKLTNKILIGTTIGIGVLYIGEKLWNFLKLD